MLSKPIPSQKDTRHVMALVMSQHQEFSAQRAGGRLYIPSHEQLLTEVPHVTQNRTAGRAAEAYWGARHIAAWACTPVHVPTAWSQPGTSVCTGGAGDTCTVRPPGPRPLTDKGTGLCEHTRGLPEYQPRGGGHECLRLRVPQCPTAEAWGPVSVVAPLRVTWPTSCGRLRTSTHDFPPTTIPLKNCDEKKKKNLAEEMSRTQISKAQLWKTSWLQKHHGYT